MSQKNNCPCMEKCPLEKAMEVIGGKWKLQIICALYNSGPCRYNELKRSLEGISNTMLASSLKDLEVNGIVSRKEFLEVPVRVEYSLTEKCDDLFPILKQLAMWGNSL